MDLRVYPYDAGQFNYQPGMTTDPTTTDVIECISEHCEQGKIAGIASKLDSKLYSQWLVAMPGNIKGASVRVLNEWAKGKDYDSVVDKFYAILVANGQPRLAVLISELKGAQSPGGILDGSSGMFSPSQMAINGDGHRKPAVLTDAMLLEVSKRMGAELDFRGLCIELEMDVDGRAINNSDSNLVYQILLDWKKDVGDNIRAYDQLTKALVACRKNMVAVDCCEMDLPFNYDPCSESEVLTDSMLLNVSQHIANKMELYALAFQLGVGDKDVPVAEQNHRSAVYHVLHSWLETNYTRREAWFKLTTALVECDKMEVAVNVCRMKAPMESEKETDAANQQLSEGGALLTYALIRDVGKHFTSETRVRGLGQSLGLQTCVIDGAITKHSDISEAAVDILSTWKSGEPSSEVAHGLLKQALVNCKEAKIIESCSMGSVPKRAVKKVGSGATEKLDDALIFFIGQNIFEENDLRVLARELDMTLGIVSALRGNNTDTRNWAGSVLAEWWKDKADSRKAFTIMMAALSGPN